MDTDLLRREIAEMTDPARIEALRGAAQQLRDAFQEAGELVMNEPDLVEYLETHDEQGRLTPEETA